MAMTLRLLVAVLSFVSLTVPAATAAPLTKAQSDALAKSAEICGTGQVADTTIAACTAVIDSHRYEGAALAVYYFDRGLNYAKSQHYPQAIADFDAAIKLKPDFANAYFVRGTVKQVMGDSAGGDADIAKAKALDPTIG